MNSKKFYAGWRAYWRGEMREENQSAEWLGGFDTASIAGEKACKESWKAFRREVSMVQDRELNYEEDGNVLFA